MRHTEGVTTPDTAWQKVALDIVERIRSGETPVGSKIASYSQLMDRHGMSQGTVKRAIDHLQGMGILRGAQGSGVFVVRIPSEDLDFSTATVADLESRIARVEEAVAGLETDKVDLREVVGLLQAHLIELYARLGQPYPHGAAEQQPLRRSRRRAAEG